MPLMSKPSAKTWASFLFVAGIGIAGVGFFRCRDKVKVKVETSGASDSGVSDSSADAPDTALGGSIAFVSNETKSDVKVYVAFGSNSVVLPASWSFCTKTSDLTCNFDLKANSEKALTLSGQYLNATFSFGAPVGCSVTKAELNINNPSWYDVMDVSLVDGYSNDVAVYVTTPSYSDAGTKVKLGPPNGASGNEKVLGLFPLGCDICTARQNPPCGMKPGVVGCKHGTQYKPDVPCQWQGPVMGGGSMVVVSYWGVPAVGGK